GPGRAMADEEADEEVLDGGHLATPAEPEALRDVPEGDRGLRGCERLTHPSYLLGQAVAQAFEDLPAPDERDDCADGHRPEVDPVRLAAVEEDVLVALDEPRDGVQEVE